MSDVAVLIEIAQISFATVAVEHLKAGNDRAALDCLHVWTGLAVAQNDQQQLSEADVVNLDQAHAALSLILHPADADSLTVLRRLALTAIGANAPDMTKKARAASRAVKWRQTKLEKTLGKHVDGAEWLAGAEPSAA